MLNVAKNIAIQSSPEGDLREDLAALYRAVARYGMSDLTYNHITARVPGHDDHLLINGVGMLYEEVTASSLCKIDLQGNVLSKPDESIGINPAGYVIHSAIHMARPDVACVIHTHSRASVAVSAMKEGLMPISQTALKFYGRIGYHDYEGPALNLDERARLIAHMGGHDVMLLRNHGTLVAGKSIAHAFVNLYYLENACRIQIDALAGARELIVPAEAVRMETVAVMSGDDRRDVDPRLYEGGLEWAAVRRQLDRADPSYRN